MNQTTTTVAEERKSKIVPVGPLLCVEGLRTYFDLRHGTVKAVDGVSFTLASHETLAIVGESGCGKTITALSLMRLVPDPPGRIVGGKVELTGTDLLRLSDDEMRAVRGKDIAMIFQEPMTSLNPLLTIGGQIAEAALLHEKINRREAWEKAVAMLRLTRIPEPEQRAHEYPHQLSGGMRQRAMIAMALACNPKVLIADEPTTALDVTIQAQILEIILDLQRKLGTAVILITHDLGVVAETAQRVIVMYAGRKVEEAPVDELFARPQHPYTRGLIGSIPRLPSMLARSWIGSNDCRRFRAQFRDWRICRTAVLSRRGVHMHRIVAARNIRLTKKSLPAIGRPVGARAKSTRMAMPDQSAVLEVCDLKKYFPIRSGLLQRSRGTVFAVDGVSFTIAPGETLGLVGESGCGKSTVGRAVTRLIEPTAGNIRISGKDISALSKTELRPYRREMQIIFQDPFSSLDPRMTAGDIVAEPLRVHKVASGRAVRDRVAALFERVGLRRAQMDNYPHQFSGGQRQRIGIARALALQPKLIVGDEPVSALDVSIQAQVLNLMMDLQRELKLAYLFISHNLAVVEHISHRIAVMYLGRIVEYTDKHTLFTRALHPYTEQLLLAVPIPDPRVKRPKRVLQGDVPSPINPPQGCHFHTRCPYAVERCRLEVPALREVRSGQLVACHLR